MANSRYLGIGGKDGTYYLVDRLTGQVVWARNVVFGGFIGGFYGGAAFDGQHIFSATGIGDDGNPLTKTGRCSSDLNPLNVFEEPSIHALNAANGQILWERSLNHSFAATSLSDGVVFSGLVGPIPIIEPPALKAYDARSGALLKTFPMPGSVNSATTPVGKMLFVTSGDSFDGKGSGVHAFTLPRREIKKVRSEAAGVGRAACMDRPMTDLFHLRRLESHASGCAINCGLEIVCQSSVSVYPG